MPNTALAMPGMRQIRFTVHNAFTQWDFSIFPICVAVVLIFVAIWYLRADWKLALRGRRWSSFRRTSFIGGLIAIELAFQSPVALLSNTYFQAHVIQHMLLMVVAPPLLALGAPSTLFLQTSKRSVKERWLAVLRSGPFAVLSHPLTVGFLYYGVMFVFFLTSLINVAMTHMALMDLINVVFLVGASLFWWPMVGLDPILHWRYSYGARLFLILLGSGLEAFLGVAILNNSHPVASMYTLASTHAGGALLWVSTEFVSLAAFVPIFVQWSRSESRVAERSDRTASARAESKVGELLGETVTSVEVTDRPLSAWEAEWLARRGSIPHHEGA